MFVLFDKNGKILRYYFSRKGATYHQQHLKLMPQSSSHSSSHLLPSDCTPLANIFSGMSFFFHEVGSAERRKELSRYIVAYDGDVVNAIDEKTTLVIFDEQSTRVSYKTNIM